MDRLIYLVVFGITHLVGLFLYALSGFPFERGIPALCFEVVAILISIGWLYLIRLDLLKRKQEEELRAEQEETERVREEILKRNLNRYDY